MPPHAVPEPARIDTVQPFPALLASEIVPASGDISARLGVFTGQPVLHLRRLVTAGGEPLALMENFVPADLIDVNTIAGSPFDLHLVLSVAGKQIRTTHQRIGARAATDEERQILEDPPGSVVLTIDRQTIDDTGRCVELARHAYRASRYEIDSMARP